jgi:NAD(P)H-hydrate epimerase
VIAGGSSMTGAGRLASWASRRVGAGLVTVAASPEVLHVYSADAPGLLTLPFRTAEEFAEIMNDERKNAVLVGPGGGVSRTTHDIALAAAAQGKGLVVDADGLTAFENTAGELFDALAGIPSVLTPHEGEFSRLFRMTGDRLSRARKAAGMSNSVILLKGADTVIAEVDGRAAINFNAPPTLAIAGTGDVLAGSILGLMAQGMPPFEASCAAAWICGDAAAAFGPGLVAEDIYREIPGSLARLHARMK